MANVKSIRNSFRAIFTSGNRGLGKMVEVINHVQEHGDTSLVALILTDADTYATDSARTYQSRIKMVFKAAYPDATFGKKKDGGFTVKRGDTFNAGAVARIEALADAGASLIGSKVKDAFGADAVTDQSDAEKKSKRLETLINQVAGLVADGVMSEADAVKALKVAIAGKAAEKQGTFAETKKLAA